VSVEPSARDAIDLLRSVAAAPRPAGGSAERLARAECARRLADAGFGVGEESFSYSTIPGRMATPAAGWVALTVLIIASYFGARERPTIALGVLVGSGVILAVTGRWIARYGVLGLPWCRETAINLVAVRGSPRVWLVAHLDSKSQPVPIVLRAAGVIGLLLVLSAALLLGALQEGGAQVARAWMGLGAAAVLASAPVIASVVQGRSPGALDDASGVVTVMLAALSLPAGMEAGVLLTSAEELGLAGASAFSESHGHAVAINVDGVDDAGAIRATYSGARPRSVLDALAEAARNARQTMRTSRLVPGVLTDGVALSRKGWECVTLSKGTLRTVARIHTPRDSVDGMTAEGMVTVAVLARDAAVRLMQRSAQRGEQRT
jgi:hypothetical protein